MREREAEQQKTAEAAEQEQTEPKAVLFVFLHKETPSRQACW